jgi:NAD(P)-dependent dehydrogenase (short-subunit alcohol dehydrogenase family)
MPGRLEGKVAVVTGGARGIGRATVEKMAREGARVSFLEVDQAAGRQALQELAGVSPEIEFLQTDVTVEDQVRRSMEDVLRRRGAVDVLVNNAGTNTYFDAAEMTEAEWDAVFAVDLKGAWLCTKHVLPAMKRAGRGSVVNIASIHANLTIPGMFPYAAAKTGMVGLTRSLALDYAPLGIRVNAVLPGWTRTRQVEDWFRRQPDPAGAERHVNEVHPLRRIAAPAEVANLIAFVASDEASAITGASLAVDCGLGIQFAT